jgi:4-hydroxyproline epimerase
MEIQVIDSHTGGEPTRVVISGWPEPKGGTVAEKRDWVNQNQAHLRNGIAREPRGSDVMVGALLVEPSDPRCVCGVIFFTTVSTLGMCGHGTIGVVETLHHLGRITYGQHFIETPVGIIDVQLHESGEVELQNVPSYRYATGVDVNGVTGDIAYGGNWFFLVTSAEHPDVHFDHIHALLRFTEQVKRDLKVLGITGENGAEIDHVEVFGNSASGAHSKNFVLCPGMSFDRSPCGTGTSAKLACLVADGKLKQGEKWIQESITGSKFTGWVTLEHEKVIPHIQGRAFITAKSALVFYESDPFRWGIH